MKKTFLVLLVLSALMFHSCRPTAFGGFYGQNNQTQVILDNANFTVLGSFSGTVTSKRNLRDKKIRDMEGLVVSQAKSKLLENAKASGAELKGSRALINVSNDVVYNRKRLTCTVSGEIIEFNK
jgi:hypothetical protein